jgi:hypothetical protein
MKTSPEIKHLAGQVFLEAEKIVENSRLYT